MSSNPRTQQVEYVVSSIILEPGEDRYEPLDLTQTFISADIYESLDKPYITADLILTIPSGETSGQNIYSVFVDSTKDYEMEARVNSADDPDKISFTYVGQITSGSKINVKIDPHDASKIRLELNSTVTVQRIA